MLKFIRNLFRKPQPSLQRAFFMLLLDRDSNEIPDIIKELLITEAKLHYIEQGVPEDKIQINRRKRSASFSICSARDEKINYNPDQLYPYGYEKRMEELLPPLGDSLAPTEHMERFVNKTIERKLTRTKQRVIEDNPALYHQSK